MKIHDESVDDIPLLQDSEPVFEEWAAETTSDIKKMLGEEEELDEEDLEDDSRKYRKRRGNPRRATLSTCEVCGIDLKHPSRIKEHMRTHTGEKPYQCDQCGKRFSQRSPLIYHYQSQHLNTLEFECEYQGGCGKRFVNASRRNAHHLWHVGLKPPRAGPPRPHLKPVKKMICPELDDNLISSMASFQEPTSLSASFSSPPTRHQPLQNPSSSSPLPPLNPSEESSESTEISEKVRESNARIDDVISSVLARVLAPQVEAIPSNPVPEERKKREYISNRCPTFAQCNVCGLFLKHPSKIREHIRTHTGEKPFQCGECGLMLSKASSLRVHIARMHTRERPFICQWGCKQAFVTDSIRKEHEMAVHAREKRYCCIIKGCGAAFARRVYLMRHRKNVHPDYFQSVFDHTQVSTEEAADHPVIVEKDDMYEFDGSILEDVEYVKVMGMVNEFDEEDYVESGGGIDDVKMQ